MDDLVLDDEFERVPLAVRPLKLAGRVAEADDVLLGAFADVTDVFSPAWRSGDAFAVGPGQRGSVGHPEVAGLAFLDLELDGAGPNLGLALNVVEDAAVPGLCGALAEGALAPLEVGAQVEAMEGLLGDNVAHLVAGNVDDSVFDRKDVLRIAVQATSAEEGIKLRKIGAMEENHCGSMGRDGGLVDGLGSRVGIGLGPG